MFVNQVKTKETNKLKIINLMSKKRVMTKNELSKELNLSIPAISSNVKELIDDGILEEGGQLNSIEGRKPALIQFNPIYRYTVGVELKDSYIKMIITDLDSKIIEQYFKKISINDPNEIIPLLIFTLENFFKASSIEQSKIIGIGFSIHGYVDDGNLIARIYYQSKIYPLSFKVIKDKFKLPIFLHNNIACAALAECTLGITSTNPCTLYLYINNGVGASIVLNNKVHMGHDNIAGAIGHMTVQIGGKACRCGSRGCWETYVTKENILTNYNLRNDSNLKELSCFFELLEKNDKIAVEVFAEYISYLEIGLRAILLMFNPDCIIIGGFLSEYFNELKKYIHLQLFTDSSGIRMEDLQIHKSSLEDIASVLGSSLVPLRSLFIK